MRKMKVYFLSISVIVLICNADAFADEALKSSILRIKDVPYICKGVEGDEGCGDKYYWENLHKGDESIPGLIDLIDDNTDSGIPVPNFGGTYTVGDIAVLQIWDIQSDFPLESIIKMNIGYTDGSEMGGFWYYWLFVRETPKNRALLKTEVDKWWHR